MAVTDDPRVGRADAADVAARAVARRLEAIRRQPRLGLSDRRPRLQVQPDRHCRRHRHSSARPGRRDAAASGPRLPGSSASNWPTWTRSSCPPDPPDRIHSWHLFPIRLRLDRLSIDRNAFIVGLRERGVGCSVHWRPLHLHPYYEETFAWRPDHLPVASAAVAAARSACRCFRA